MDKVSSRTRGGKGFVVTSGCGANVLLQVFIQRDAFLGHGAGEERVGVCVQAGGAWVATVAVLKGVAPLGDEVRERGRQEVVLRLSNVPRECLNAGRCDRLNGPAGRAHGTVEQ